MKEHRCTPSPEAAASCRGLPPSPSSPCSSPPAQVRRATSRSATRGPGPRRWWRAPVRPTWSSRTRLRSRRPLGGTQRRRQGGRGPRDRRDAGGVRRRPMESTGMGGMESPKASDGGMGTGGQHDGHAEDRPPGDPGGRQRRAQARQLPHHAHRPHPRAQGRREDRASPSSSRRRATSRSPPRSARTRPARQRRPGSVFEQRPDPEPSAHEPARPDGRSGSTRIAGSVPSFARQRRPGGRPGRPGRPCGSRRRCPSRWRR